MAPIADRAFSTQSIRFEISPNPAFVDEEVRIRVRGLHLNHPLILRATTEDDDARRWRSQAHFRADESGSTDTAAQESLGGTYHGVSPMGLLWSMRLDDAHANGHSMFAKNGVLPNRVSFQVELDGRIVASTELERPFLAPGTEIRDLNIDDNLTGNGRSHETGRVGRLFIPPGHGPHPVVIVLSGSGGGFDLDKAATLSRHGFATLALAYFGISPLPAWLHRIPLDYFEAALAWLASHPELDTQRIAALGVSRGAELALLLGTKFPLIRAIVAYAPSSVAWAAGGREKATGEIIPSWIWR
ncbi:MAG TPA: acyl-CoA thioesterase/BAAT N-terminal domain-containing protein, partial [Candidatus Limnocylindria bacterium]|nr:acyl-CoA thioesterase/BAAT N-terminal domain-containing protein [Candidatus Limnocylindria bacterium]